MFQPDSVVQQTCRGCGRETSFKSEVSRYFFVSRADTRRGVKHACLTTPRFCQTRAQFGAILHIFVKNLLINFVKIINVFHNFLLVYVRKQHQRCAKLRAHMVHTLHHFLHKSCEVCHPSHTLRCVHQRCAHSVVLSCSHPHSTRAQHSSTPLR